MKQEQLKKLYEVLIKHNDENQEEIYRLLNECKKCLSGMICEKHFEEVG